MFTDAPLAVTIAADTVAHPRMSRISLDTEANMTPLQAVHKPHGGAPRSARAVWRPAACGKETLRHFVHRKGER